LYVLLVLDKPPSANAPGSLIGAAPWLLESSGPRGRVVRMLGSGEVCSDYMSLLALTGREDHVARAVAAWLIEAAEGRNDSESKNSWDLLELTGVASSDATIAQLVSHLTESGAGVHRRPGPNCWRIELAGSWNDYLGQLSKSHRKQVRRVERRLLESGRAVLHTAANADELERGLEILIDLHQRRRKSLGEPGCFASPPFDGFVRDVAARLFERGGLHLHWVEVEGRPAAAEFHLVGSDVVYAYQAGIDPEQIDEEPGRIINVATIKKALDEGRRGFDFLRGDEPYKAHWRAQPTPSLELRIVPDRAVAKVRHGIWLAGGAVKSWIKSGLNLSGMR
jgi:CelD/BcsL family acetyltransferase involved in cellulose biosynthesis